MVDDRDEPLANAEYDNVERDSTGISQRREVEARHGRDRYPGQYGGL